MSVEGEQKRKVRRKGFGVPKISLDGHQHHGHGRLRSSEKCHAKDSSSQGHQLGTTSCHESHTISP